MKSSATFCFLRGLDEQKMISREGFPGEQLNRVCYCSLIYVYVWSVIIIVAGVMVAKLSSKLYQLNRLLNIHECICPKSFSQIRLSCLWVYTLSTKSICRSEFYCALLDPEFMSGLKLTANRENVPGNEQHLCSEFCRKTMINKVLVRLTIKIHFIGALCPSERRNSFTNWNLHFLPSPLPTFNTFLFIKTKLVVDCKSLARKQLLTFIAANSILSTRLLNLRQN